MKNYIIVGTMNIQNKYKITEYDGMDDKGNDNAQLLNRFLVENNIDAIGTQELVRDFIKRIINTIRPNYKITGNYRFGSSNIVQKINFFDRFNETASIITKHKIIKTKTYTLPWIPHHPKDLIASIKKASLRPRVVTSALIEIPNFGKINFVNTHLEHKISIIQIRQMNYIQKIIEKSKYPVILTGDFNMTTNIPRFKMFIDNMSQIGYKRVPNKKMTWKYQKDKLPIDHIFIPNDWVVEAVSVLQDEYLNNFSDHYPLLVKISKK